MRTIKVRPVRLFTRLAVVLVVTGTLAIGGAAEAQTGSAVGLGTADNFAVLAGQGVTNTGPTTVNGDLGTWPNPAVTGAGLTVNGTIHAADAVAQQAQADTTIAYDDAAGRPCDTDLTGQDLGGLNLTAGVYCFDTSAQLTGALTLDLQGDPGAVFIFQVGSTLTTASGSTVALVNGSDACNVFWKVGSSATLGTGSTFRGTILALSAVTVTTGVTVHGRALARNAAVTLDTDTVTRATCTTPTTTGTTLTSSVSPADSGEAVTFTATVSADAGGPPVGTVTFFDNGSPIGSGVLDDGVATLTTTELTPGDHVITAVYLGSPGFVSSPSPELTQVVNAAPPVVPPVTAGATTSPAVPASASSAAPGATPGTLARTGASWTRSAALVGSLLVAFGVIFVLAGSRSRRAAPPAAR